MQRVLVLGMPGAGKSTFARRLGEVTGLPVIHLDAEFWQPGWQLPDPAVWTERQRELARGDRWIMEGNYDRSLDVRLPRADTVIAFDIPRVRALWRIAKRIASNYGRVRPDMAPGCPEQIDLGFIKYIWQFPTIQLPRSRAQILAHGVTPVILRSDHESAAFLERARRRQVDAPRDKHKCS